MSLRKALVAISCLLHLVQSQDNTNCETKETCSECIQNLNCVWCISPLLSANASSTRCRHQNTATGDSGWCPEDKLVNPLGTFSVLQDDELRSEESGDAVQIRPQRVAISLRKGEEYKLRFQYAQARNYPVDLYYIMDLSASMEDHRLKLAALGDKLAQTMRNITNNFRLGFGSFVDKVALPFTSTAPEKVKMPCVLNKRGVRIECRSPYSFKNHMSLNEDYQMFSEQVNQARVSGNLDAPEGGFDAIMQAIVCKDVIGWREQARHLLVFSTDADYHVAGDGKLAGVVEPHDGRCHMRGDEYDAFLTYDYPSVSQINHVAIQNNINLIFAVVKRYDTLERYQLLTERIEYSNAGGLEGDSQNVIKLVLDNYNKIVDSVTLTSNASSDVDVKFTSTCANPKESGCTGVHVGQVVDFTATLRLLECRPDAPRTRTLHIKPEALEETLLVELTTLCGCPCEDAGHADFTPAAPECGGRGDLACGVCACDADRVGKSCECDADAVASAEDDANCKVNPDDDEACSGQGKCWCGRCQCHPRSNPGEQVYGKFCQCDNYSCKREGGVLCSGRGTCDCGRCLCHAGWGGDTCHCPDSNATCVAPRDALAGHVCSDRGSCVCGKCECRLDSYRYSGRYCEECPTCPAQRCQELRDCVECQAYKTGIYNELNCKKECLNFTTQIVPKIEEDYLEDNVKVCRVPDKSGCTFIFRYTYDEKKTLIVEAQKEKICPTPVNVLAYILGVIGTIIVAGVIMLIIWKCVTTLHDRREYAKFLDEQEKRKWHIDSNPLYKGATSTFNNPAFNRGSRRYSFGNSK